MRRTLTLALSALTACQFDGAGIQSGDDGQPPVVEDGRTADAGSCPEPVKVSATVNGIEIQPGGGPFARVLIGDLIVLDASASCSQAGSITNYSFTVEPTNLIAGRTQQGATLRFYAIREGAINVAISVEDQANQVAELPSAYAVEVSAWKRDTDPLVADLDIQDIAIGGGAVWMATTSGPFAVEIGNGDVCSGAGSCDLDDELEGPDPDDVRAVVFDEPTSLLWVAGKNGVFRADMSASTRAFTFIDIPSGGNDDTRELAPEGGGGVWAVTRDGAFTADADVAAFSLVAPGIDLHSVATGSGRTWGGGRTLFELPAVETVDVFADDDDKIRALLLLHGATDDELWIGSDDFGVAFGTADGVIHTRFSAANSDLQTDRIRDLAGETADARAAGDVWAATDAGVARRSRDFAEWIPMRSPQGLDESDVKAIAVDERSGSRAIYAGTKSGLFVLRVD